MRRLVLTATLIVASLMITRPGPVLASDTPSAAVKAATEKLLRADDAALARAMASVDNAQRQAAAVVLGRRADATPDQIAALIEASGDELIGVRLAATRALGALGDAALPAAKRLERLAGWASRVPQRHEAALALSCIPAAREHLLRLFEDPTQRADTAIGLAGLGARGRTALIALTDAPQWRTRVVAVAVLPDTKEGAENADVRAAIGRRLRDESSAVRVAALLALPRIRGGALLTTDDAERVFAPGADATERRALLVALATDGTPVAPTDPAVRAAGALLALSRGTVDERLVGVRLAHAAWTKDEAVLRALAAVTNSDEVGPAREAAAYLRLVGATTKLPQSVADALRPATQHERARIATEAAAALAGGGYDGPELAAPLARLMYAHSWGAWRTGNMATPPFGGRGRQRRNLRAGWSGLRGRPLFSVPSLPAVPLLRVDDLVPFLGHHSAAAGDALSPYLAGEYAATRANAALMVGSVCPRDRVEELLLPLLDDPALSVRLTAGLRLARLDVATDRIARLFVETLLDDDLFADDGRVLFWDKLLIAVLPRAEATAVRALLSAHAENATVDEHGNVQWSSPPGARHVPAILRALGPAAHVLLVDELLEGDLVHRTMAWVLLDRVDELSPAATARLRGLRDDPDIGSYARQLVGDD